MDPYVTSGSTQLAERPVIACSGDVLSTRQHSTTGHATEETIAVICILGLTLTLTVNPYDLDEVVSLEFIPAGRPASCPVRARYRHWRNVAEAAGRQTSVSWSITLQTLMSGRASRTAAAAAAAGAGGSAAA